MHFDPSLISIDELSNSNSLVGGVDLFSKVKEPGFFRVLMFSMNLDKVSNANQLSNIIDFNVTSISDNYNATITFDNIILAGENGQELDYPDTYVSELNSDDLIPSSTELSNIYPNPFNPQTNINYSIKDLSDVNISVYNVNGRKMEELLNAQQLPGQYHLTWTAADIPSGIYIVRMTAGSFEDARKVMLLK